MNSKNKRTSPIQSYKGDWALVSGASSGIGREFAQQLAEFGLNLVLVARRKDLLESLSEDLRRKHGVQTLVAAVDLTEIHAIENLKDLLCSNKVKIRLLCNNAGIGQWGPFEKSSAGTCRKILELNTSVLTRMCLTFQEELSSFATSAVINVSSAAAYQPVPYMAVYAASKSYVHQFSQALHGEWKEKGILVQTLVPGPTETEFDHKAGAYESALQKRDKCSEVVKQSLKGLGRGSPVVVTAQGTYGQRIFAGLFPAALVIRTVSKMFKPPQA